MTDAQVKRRDALGAIPKKARDTSVEAEKAALDSLWRESPVTLASPFGMLLDWFGDGQSGGGDLKTWAGQQSVVDIARGMQASTGRVLGHTPVEECLSAMATEDFLPFNFDSDLGAVGGALDVGFSFDPLKQVAVRTKPTTELAAFVGLQRFRPFRVDGQNRYRYTTWNQPLIPTVAQAAACGLLGPGDWRTWEFSLLYRTKYLKSFLPSQTTGGPYERRITGHA